MSLSHLNYKKGWCWQNGGEGREVATRLVNRDIKRLNDALTRLRFAMPSLIVRKPKKPL